MPSRNSPLHRSLLAVVTATVLLLPTFGCTSKPQLVAVVHESPKGSVFLVTPPRSQFEASHPILIDPTTIRRILKGVVVKKRPRGLLNAKRKKPAKARAFSKKQREFLAPLLSTALAIAEPRERVAFRAMQWSGAGPVATAGIVYAHGSYMYLTLTHFRYKPHDEEILFRTKTPLPYSTALTRRTVLFIPTSLGQPTEEEPPGALLHPTLVTLAIEFHPLAAKSPTRSQEVQDAELIKVHQARQVVTKKEAELKDIKGRIQALKQSIAQQEHLLKTLNEGGTPSKSEGTPSGKAK